MDVDVVINLRARRGSQVVADKVQREMPHARILTSRSLEEAARFTRTRTEGSLLVSAGGDGTALGLLNTLRKSVLSLGVLPLGTGNAWAHSTGAPHWRKAVERLGAAVGRSAPLPMRRFQLVEVSLPGQSPGTLAHFAGSGWDAEIIDDFHTQKSGFGVLPKSFRNGVAGYFQGTFLRTIPRHIRGRTIPEVEIVNTGSDAMTVDENGRAVPLPGGEHGKVLYRGPTNVCAVGTCENWGFGFRAFPFAGLVDDRVCLRIYSGTVTEATANMRRLWRGVHPMPKMHTFLIDRCRARFSRPVPFQAGGDRLGHHQDIEYALAREAVDLVDWPRLAAA